MSCGCDESESDCPTANGGTGPVGPTGPAGATGPAGEGGNAYTVTTAQFTMPLGSADVAIVVAETGWMVVGQIIFIGTAGYFSVTTIDSATGATVNNLGYNINTAPGTIITAGQGVSPGGEKGDTGPSPGVVTSLNSLSPTTTKGDLMVDNGANAPLASVVRIAVGADTLVLMADSTQPTGIKWAQIALGTGSTLTGQLPIARGGTAALNSTGGFNNLAPASPAAGAIITFDGTNWVKLALGTALQVLRVNAGATALEYGAGSNAVIQMVSASNASFSSITGVIPYDDTIPQIGEGTQITSLSITPSSNTTRLLIEAEVPGVADVSDNYILAIFNGGANAIAAALTVTEIAETGLVLTLSTVVVPGATTPLTISLRLGSSGSAFELNGRGGVRKLGGVSKAWLRATEFA